MKKMKKFKYLSSECYKRFQKLISSSKKTIIIKEKGGVITMNNTVYFLLKLLLNAGLFQDCSS